MTALGRGARLLCERRLHILALAAALAATGYLRVFHVIVAAPGHPFAAIAVEMAGTYLLLALLIVAVISFCEARWPPGGRRCAALVLMHGGVLAAASAALAMTPLGTSQTVRVGIQPGGPLFTYLLWLSWFAAGLMTWYYAARGRSERMARALGEAGVERQRAQQRLIESRLQVLQARVDPQALLARLERLEATYAKSFREGEEALDLLIDELHGATQRASIPPQ
ncbi:MAG TPA: hypothetical protein VM122_06765 [Usitatibacter sp.]|nr:hypothetical protein [Usitatibacter sp.]